MTTRNYYQFFYRILRQCEEFPIMKEHWFDYYRDLAPQIADAAEKSYLERNK